MTVSDGQEGARKKTRIVLVDDHPVVRGGLRQLIDGQDDMAVCGEAEDAVGALAEIEAQRPDLVVMDIGLKGRDGIEVIKDLRARGNRVRILVMSVHDEAVYAERSLRAGAEGYIMKREAPGSILRAIRKIVAGDIFVGERVATRMLSRVAGRPEVVASSDPVASLTDRELEILILIGEGHGPKAIGERLGLSVNTVEAHRTNIKTKLGISTAFQLGQFAADWLLKHR